MTPTGTKCWRHRGINVICCHGVVCSSGNKKFHGKTMIIYFIPPPQVINVFANEKLLFSYVDSCFTYTENVAPNIEASQQNCSLICCLIRTGFHSKALSDNNNAGKLSIHYQCNDVTDERKALEK